MIKHNGFTVNVTTKVTLPDVDYINKLAIEKNFSLSNSFIDPPKLLEDLYFLFDMERKDPDEFDIKKYLFPSSYIESDILFRPMNDGERAYYENTLSFLQTIDFGNVIGMTPLDKSLNVLMYLTQLTSTNSNNKQRTTSDPRPEVNVIPDEKAISDSVSEMANGMSADQSGVSSPNSDEISTDITKCVRDHLYDLSPTVANIYGKKKPSDVPINRAILGDIKIKAYLEGTKGLETALESKKKRNNNSKEKQKFQMEEHSQITKVSKTSMALDTFDDKLIKKELTVKEKVKPQEKKQILYMLLDDSGSMCCAIKQTYVRATLLNRLESVVDGKSELKFSLYETNRYGYKEATDLQSAQKLFQDISLRRPGGGGTYIGNVLQDTINEIHNIPDYHDPEIMIVCDGDDYVKPESLDFKGVKVHCMLLGTHNSGLEKVAKLSGGWYLCEKLYDR